ncbi:diguanylate cyclase [Vibrio sp. RE86]|uniref:sensor domain-containing diguanylate cyclase n=1 Tax=Vibrio sp. RE86 TaxID=2607605 RepID=UPI0020A49C47|nr:diguanylate cyclase [Vibrio sp. RE86]
MHIFQLSIKQLTVLASLMMASLFVFCYLTFRYFWTYDSEVEQALAHQQEEVNRVKTVLDIQKSELARALVDYAAWDDVSDFIEGGDTDFLSDSLNDHTFQSKQLSGVFIFDEKVSLMWGRHYDYIFKKELPFTEIRYKFGPLLVDALKSRTDFITPHVKFLVLNNKPTMLATSRVCNSEGHDCDRGFMMFIKPIGSDFIRNLKQATGLDVEVLIADDGEAKHRLPVPNVTELEKLDYQNQSTVRVRIQHSIKLPHFITWGELSALFAFAGFMFAFNLAVAHLMVRPIKRARNALNSLGQGELMVNEQEQFISYEMRDFICRINEVYTQLDEKQQELEWISRHDTLTTVGNRRSLQQYWQKMLAKEDHGYACMVLIDIDYFKRFNDHYGHLEGDFVLRKVAQQLEMAETQCDKFVARFGGEEFCILLTSNGQIDAYSEGEALRLAIEKMAISHNHSPIAPVITISVGVADCANKTLQHQQEILLIADKALYAAKDNGRNGVLVAKY